MKDKPFVGAKAVKCKCIYCSDCLVLKEVLYDPNTKITKSEARKHHYKCVSCSCLLEKLKGQV